MREIDAGHKREIYQEYGDVIILLYKDFDRWKATVSTWACENKFLGIVGETKTEAKEKIREYREDVGVPVIQIKVTNYKRGKKPYKLLYSCEEFVHFGDEEQVKCFVEGLPSLN